MTETPTKGVLRAIMLLAFACGFVVGRASAQTTNVFGPSGQYLGTVQTTGPISNIYGPSGQWLGMTTTMGPPPVTTPWMPAPVVPVMPAWPILPTWGK